MASFNDFLTTEGQKVFALMAQGGEVTFTRMVLGDGILDSSESEVDMKDVISPVVTLNIDSVTTSEDNQVTIRAVFQNTQSRPFYMREKGVYATVDGADEVLVFYANNGAMAEYVEVANTQLVEKIIKTVIIFSESDNINISLSSNDVFEKLADVERELEEHRHDNATTTTDGFMSSDDKVTLDKYKSTLGTVTGKTDSLEVKSSEILVTAKALSYVTETLKSKNLNTYYSLESFGVTTGKETIKSMATNLPNYSIALLPVSYDNNNSMTIYPEQKNGTLLIYKYNTSRCFLQYILAEGNRLFFGTYYLNSESTSYTWTGWEEYARRSELNTVTEIQNTSVTATLTTGYNDVTFTRPTKTGYEYYPICISTNTKAEVSVLSNSATACRIWNGSNNNSLSVTFTVVWLGRLK